MPLTTGQPAKFDPDDVRDGSDRTTFLQSLQKYTPLLLLFTSGPPNLDPVEQGWANVSWSGPNLKFSDFWWATSFISIYIVARHKNYGGSFADVRQFIIKNGNINNTINTVLK